MRLGGALLTAAAVATMLTGCSSSDESNVRTALSEYVDGSTARVRDGDLEVTTKTRVTKKDKDGKKKTTTKTSHHTAPDVSSGDGFTLVKSGDHWLVSAGI
ncbi:hypothetical protein [Cryptosporangium phraense]|uniref:Uncharacterized protein n=1 Tax=Cryptosporangium phraense TaxID=2593070 RepID=A0A545AJQ3_9ACTN|nr:hypothetical protein [Cryptosporangium phraense]TQS40955.1 hypothetical protein FL583_31725 [Cryptosporangium phraense]